MTSRAPALRRYTAPRPALWDGAVRRARLRRLAIPGICLAGGAPGEEDARQRILILSVAGLGDFILGTPALRAIRQHFPRACIWILTIPEVSALAQRCPYVNAVRTLDLRSSRSGLAWALGLRQREMRQLTRELQGMQFDLAINLYDVGTRIGGLRMAVFLWAIRARRSVGRWSGGRAIGFDLTSKTEGHETDAQLGVTRLVGASPTSDLPELWVTNEDRLACASLLVRHGVPESDQVVCLHAGAAQPEKLWPRENFAVVGQRLAGAGARVMLIGTERERALCGVLVQAIPGAISLAGETSLPVLAALLQRSALLVTNDSGPMHMAAALGVPLVVAFGPAAPDRFGPRGRGIRLVFAAIGQPGMGPWWEEVRADAVSDAAVRLFVETAAQAGAPGGDA